MDVGAGYRVYFTMRNGVVIVLLAGGDKSSRAGKEIGKGGLSMSQTLTTFDMAALLDSDEAISEYLSQVLADGDNDEFLRAIGYVAKARGMAQIAKDSGLGRESLYKAFAPGSKPRFDTVLKVIHALGIDLHAKPSHVASHSTA